MKVNIKKIYDNNMEHCLLCDLCVKRCITLYQILSDNRLESSICKDCFSKIVKKFKQLEEK